MTKSRQSVTKLRLSRIIKCLVALGCIKLCLIAFGAMDIHWTNLFNSADKSQLQQEVVRKSINIDPESVSITDKSEPELIEERQTPDVEELPLGSKAAELAAAAKPQRKSSDGIQRMPAPLLPAEPFTPLLTSESPYFSSSSLPEPAPLGLPLVEAGVSLPAQENAQKPENTDSIWDMTALTSLPIPGLGSGQAAYAASLDMPVPATTNTISPFTPGEQVNPVGNQGRVIPGAPAFPQNIPAASADGAPLPPRQPTLGQTGNYAPLPGTPATSNAPAPNITPRPTDLNPNMKAQELARQQQDILMLRQQMDQRLQDLQTAEDKMKSMLEQAKDVEDQKVKTLVQMYANMKPRTAAQALENMDERIAVRILSGMAPKQSGEILTYTNPVKTAKFTEMITRLRMSGE